jgi:hypothetical protein
MTMLGATAGYKLFHRLFRMLGPTFGSMMDIGAEAKSVEDIDVSSKTVVDAIRMLSENVKEEDLEHVIDELKSQSHVGPNGSDKTIPLAQVFEAHFAGDITGLFRWLFWGLQVQYSTFRSVFRIFASPAEEDTTQAATNQSP